jgi:amino acid transporter
VARDNLGVLVAQIAGASLLIDYILTVAVSASAGVDAVNSLWQVYYGHGIPVLEVCLAAVLVIMIINLRGVRESGVIFAIPTYLFMLVVFLLIGFGAWQMMHGTLGLAHPMQEFLAAQAGSEANPDVPATGVMLGAFLLMHAFASGCTAMTGVEAISNGTKAFQEPSARNAAKTMVYMALLLGAMFAGLTFFAVHTNTLPEVAIGFHGETTMSQIGRTIFGKGPLYLWLQLSTALILFLAANTSFAGFPHLGALIAQDGFLPKPLSNLGDRLVYDRGIVALGVLAALLIIWRHADVHSLIPLYAVGVFLSFTISQTGMFLRWRRLRTPGWRLKALINGVGAVITCLVLVLIGVVKFVHGAWLVVVLIPLLVLLFLRIHAHYVSVREQLKLVPNSKPLDEIPPQHAVLVLVPGPTKGAMEAVDYARSLTGDCRAIHVEAEPEKTPALREEWMRHCAAVPLVILSSPFRSVVDPLMEYLDEVQRETPTTRVTVVLPEFVAPHWWQNLLHGHTGLLLKLALLNRKNVVVTNVRYHLADERVSLREMLDAGKEYTGEL